MDIARKIGLSVESYRQLLNGEVPESVARRFGSTTEALQEFVDGGTSLRLAQYLVAERTSSETFDVPLGERVPLGS